MKYHRKELLLLSSMSLPMFKVLDRRWKLPWQVHRKGIPGWRQAGEGSDGWAQYDAVQVLQLSIAQSMTGFLPATKAASVAGMVPLGSMRAGGKLDRYFCALTLINDLREVQTGSAADIGALLTSRHDIADAYIFDVSNVLGKIVARASQSGVPIHPELSRSAA